MEATTLVFVLAALTACAGSGNDDDDDDDGDGGGSFDSGSDATVDRDGDGFPTSEDCDDADPDIHPDAAERCDGLDNDCDGLVDDDDDGLESDDLQPIYTDDDGDGYGTGSPLGQACAAPAGTATRTGDCDDSDDRINPGRSEICNDGVDNDCNGGRNGCGVWGEGEYDDMNDASIHGTEPSTKLPSRHGVSSGDFDGDGEAELVLGSAVYGYNLYGRVWVFSGRYSRNAGVNSAETIVENPYGYYELGASVLGGYDADRDGYDDLVVGAPGVPGVVLWDGPLARSEDTNAVWGALVGPSDLGQIVAVAELDGDGEADLLMVADDVTYGISGEFDPRASDFGPTHELTLETPAHLKSADLNGDGFDELLAGVYRGGTAAGELRVIPGDWSGVLVADDVAFPIATTGYRTDEFATADLDEDGYIDLLIGSNDGDLAIVYGPVTAARTADSADIQRESAGMTLTTLDVLADFTGDGHVDIVAAHLTNYDSATYVLEGPFLEPMSVLEAATTLRGDMASISYRRVHGVGDLDHDGTEDFAITEPGLAHSGDSEAGAVWLYFGGGL